VAYGSHISHAPDILQHNYRHIIQQTSVKRTCTCYRKDTVALARLVLWWSWQVDDDQSCILRLFTNYLIQSHSGMHPLHVVILSITTYRSIWPQCKQNSHSIVTARLDYCTALLDGTSNTNLDRLQVAQKALARTVCPALRPASATALCCQLHWLPVCHQIQYKLAVIAYKTRSAVNPSYLLSLLNTYIPPRTLRNSVKNLLIIPRMTLAQSAEAFCVNAPSVWNSLSDHCKQAELITTFKTDSKLNCFTQATSINIAIQCIRCACDRYDYDTNGAI